MCSNDCYSGSSLQAWGPGWQYMYRQAARLLPCLTLSWASCQQPADQDKLPAIHHSHRHAEHALVQLLRTIRRRPCQHTDVLHGTCCAALLALPSWKVHTVM
jgi:hypothetical protein